MSEVAEKLELEEGTTLLIDQANITAYGVFRFDEPGALQMVLIGDRPDPPRPEDIANRSDIVKSIPEERLYRVYVPTVDSVEKLHKVWKGVAR